MHFGKDVRFFQYEVEGKSLPSGLSRHPLPRAGVRDPRGRLLVGRDAECQRIARVMHAAHDSRGSMVVLSGEAGTLRARSTRRCASDQRRDRRTLSPGERLTRRAAHRAGG